MTGSAETSHDSAGPARWAERVLGCALLAGTVAVVLLSRGVDVAERLSAWPWSGWWYGLLALPPVAFIVGAAARRPVPRLGAALDVGLFIWAVAAIVGAWFAESRPVAMSAALLPFSTICLAYVVRGWLGFDPVISRRRARHALVVVAVALAVVLATAWWAPAPVPPGRAPAAIGLAAMALPVFVGLATTARGVSRVASLVAAAGALSFVGLAGGLAGGCALGAIVLCAGVALIATHRARWVGWTGVMIGAAVVVGLCVGSWTPDRAATDRSMLAARERTALIKAGVAMGADRPWVGYGPAMVAWVFPRYRARFSAGTNAVSALPSTPVQVWAENGALGLLAMASLGLGVSLRAWRLRPGGIAAEAGSHEDRVLAWAMVGALGAGGGFALAEYPLDAPPLLAVFATLLPVLSALTRPVTDARVAWSPTFVRVTPAVVVGATLALIGSYVWPNLRAGRKFAAGMSASTRGDTERYFAAVRRARELAPWDPAYPAALARHLVDEAARAADAGRASMARTLAIGQLRQVVVARPGQVACYLEMGSLLLGANEPSAAAVEFREAARYAPDKGEIYHQLGVALLRAARANEALDAFACEWIIHPAAAQLARWTYPEVNLLRAKVAAAAAARLTQLARDSRRPDVVAIANDLAQHFADPVSLREADASRFPPEGWLPARDRQRVVEGLAN